MEVKLAVANLRLSTASFKSIRYCMYFKLMIYKHLNICCFCTYLVNVAWGQIWNVNILTPRGTSLAQKNHAQWLILVAMCPSIRLVIRETKRRKRQRNIFRQTAIRPDLPCRRRRRIEIKFYLWGELRETVLSSKFRINQLGVQRFGDKDSLSH